MSLCFWKGVIVFKVFICRSGLPSTGLTGELGSLSRLLSVVSLGLIFLPAQDVQWTLYGPFITIPPSPAVCKVASHSIGSTFRHSCTSPATVCSGGSVFSPSFNASWFPLDDPSLKIGSLSPLSSPELVFF